MTIVLKYRKLENFIEVKCRSLANDVANDENI